VVGDRLAVLLERLALLLIQILDEMGEEEDDR
jgi:hypothetical protein